MKKSREEKIKNIEETIAKQKAELAKHEASLKAERDKLRDEQLKKLETICKNGGFSVNDVIELAAVIMENKLTVNDVISVIGGESKSKE